MKRKTLLRSAAATLILAGAIWLGWRATDEKRGQADADAGGIKHPAASASSGQTAPQDEASLPTKLGDRPPPFKRADDQEVAKFRRFFLPPIELNNVTLEEAVAKVIQVYRETALATSEVPLDLKIDLKAASRKQRITCTTPRNTAGVIIRFLGFQSGNSVAGALPEFRFIALNDNRNQAGTTTTPPDLVSRLLAELPPGEGSGEHSKLTDLARKLGIGDDTTELTLSGGTLTYRNLSTEDLAKLTNLIEMGQEGEFGPVQAKTRFMLISASESILQNPGVHSLTAEEMNAQMRAFAMVKGTDLMTVPAITSRGDESATVEIAHDPTANNGMSPPVNGIKLTVNAVPLGLGSQLSLSGETSTGEGEPVSIQDQFTIPEAGAGFSVIHSKDGKVLIALPAVSMIDATGRPYGQN